MEETLNSDAQIELKINLSAPSNTGRIMPLSLAREVHMASRAERMRGPRMGVMVAGLRRRYPKLTQVQEPVGLNRRGPGARQAPCTPPA